uniref:C4 protein n=1 Tax=Tomato leaf curl virus TaxID=28350 RepID=A0A2S1GGT0_9GEMI|nr:C4 protein [Tomato leaf curl virus]
MGLLTCMCSSSSKESSSAKTIDSSTSHPQTGQPNSTQTSRELRAPAMSSPISRRTVITSIMGCFRSMDDLLEEVNRQLMMLQQRPYMQGSKLRLSIY